MRNNGRVGLVWLQYWRPKPLHRVGADPDKASWAVAVEHLGRVDWRAAHFCARGRNVACIQRRLCALGGQQSARCAEPVLYELAATDGTWSGRFHSFFSDLDLGMKIRILIIASSWVECARGGPDVCYFMLEKSDCIIHDILALSLLCSDFWSRWDIRTWWKDVFAFFWCKNSSMRNWTLGCC